MDEAFLDKTVKYQGFRSWVVLHHFLKQNLEQGLWMENESPRASQIIVECTKYAYKCFGILEVHFEGNRIRFFEFKTL